MSAKVIDLNNLYARLQGEGFTVLEIQVYHSEERLVLSRAGITVTGCGDNLETAEQDAKRQYAERARRCPCCGRAL